MDKEIYVGFGVGIRKKKKKTCWGTTETDYKIRNAFKPKKRKK